MNEPLHPEMQLHPEKLYVTSCLNPKDEITGWLVIVVDQHNDEGTKFRAVSGWLATEAEAVAARERLIEEGWA